jgi:two-component system, chemotaxis family, protein-glutamate methylesterase/glutaminase
MIRVIVADDSATARQLLRAVLEQDRDIQVIAEARDGAEAIQLVERHRPDLVVMDVHMPVADGLEATKQIMMRAPTPILIVSAVSQRDVDLSLSATQAGALMALAKPDSPASPRFSEAAAELRSMARAMAQVKVVRRWADTPARARVNPVERTAQQPPGELVAIAASTGGPAALRRILTELPATFATPIVVVQHIARDFTRAFADWLGGSCMVRVKVAESGERLRPGTVYIAPDDGHVGISADRSITVSHAAAIGGFRPSATFLFESAARVYGPRLVAVVLTGMGTDGAAGLEAAHAAGAYVLAQDEATSVVYGMAQEAVRRGAVDAVVPLEQIAARLVETVAPEAHVD